MTRTESTLMALVAGKLIPIKIPIKSQLLKIQSVVRLSFLKKKEKMKFEPIRNHLSHKATG